MSVSSNRGFDSQPHPLQNSSFRSPNHTMGHTHVHQSNVQGSSFVYMANSCSKSCSQLVVIHQLLVVAMHISCRFKAGDRTQVEGAVGVLQLPQVPQFAQLLPLEVWHVLPPLLQHGSVTTPVRLQ